MKLTAPHHLPLTPTPVFFNSRVLPQLYVPFVVCNEIRYSYKYFSLTIILIFLYKTNPMYSYTLQNTSYEHGNNLLHIYA